MNKSNVRIKAGITVFPGSNCDYDVYNVLTGIFKVDASFIWHKDKIKSYGEYDFIVIPGGFSYGDYLRAGALAARSEIMKAMNDYAENGGIILGICNGFQILLESKLLDGVMLTNKSLKFECRDIYLKPLNLDTPFTCAIKTMVAGGNENAAMAGGGNGGTFKLKMPIAHHDGNYFATPQIIDGLNSNNGVIFKYCDEKGEITETANPNGSLYNIAGISNNKHNVMGLMPHPERSSEKLLGSEDGGYIFKSLIKYIREK